MITDVEQTIREYLPQTFHMSLGTSRDNKPWVCEVHFAFDDDLNLYWRSTPDRRHSQEIADNPNVAGNIVVQHPLDLAPRGVYFEGKAKLLGEGAELDAAFKALSERNGTTQEKLDEALADPTAHQFYKVAVDTFYLFDGRESSPGQKYELPWGVK